MNEHAIPVAASERPSRVGSARLLNLTDWDNIPGRAEGVFLPDNDVVEVTLLLPSDQAAVLERVAHRRGLAVGQLIRRLLWDSLVSLGPKPVNFHQGYEGPGTADL